MRGYMRQEDIYDFLVTKRRQAINIMDISILAISLGLYIVLHHTVSFYRKINKPPLNFRELRWKI